MSDDTDCRKCKTPMLEAMHKINGKGPLASAALTVTGYLCAKCGHWNNLKRRKNKQQEVE